MRKKGHGYVCVCRRSMWDAGCMGPCIKPACVCGSGSATRRKLMNRGQWGGREEGTYGKGRKGCYLSGRLVTKMPRNLQEVGPGGGESRKRVGLGWSRLMGGRAARKLRGALRNEQTRGGFELREHQISREGRAGQGRAGGLCWRAWRCQ